MDSRATPGPRKIVVGTTTLAPFDPYVPGGDTERLANGLAAIDEMARRAETLARPLDMVLLPEHFSMSGNQIERAEPVDGPTVEAVASRARRYGTYAAVPLWLREGETVSNALVLLSRQGAPIGIYRKVHPVVFPNGTLENGVLPGGTFPVFDLDIGRVGAMICFDEYFEDGWDALGEAGAELVLFPSASSAVTVLRSHAWRNSYYILASTYRPPTVIVDPLGGEVARTASDREVLVAVVDLDYRIVPWDALPDFGESLGQRYGTRLGQDWHYEEDLCLLTSLDPDLPIQRVMEEEGLFTLAEFLARNRRAQEDQRGGPPRSSRPGS